MNLILFYFYPLLFLTITTKAAELSPHGNHTHQLYISCTYFSELRITDPKGAVLIASPYKQLLNMPGVGHDIKECQNCDGEPPLYDKVDPRHSMFIGQELLIESPLKGEYKFDIKILAKRTSLPGESAPDCFVSLSSGYNRSKFGLKSEKYQVPPSYKVGETFKFKFSVPSSDISEKEASIKFGKIDGRILSLEGTFSEIADSLKDLSHLEGIHFLIRGKSGLSLDIALSSAGLLKSSDYLEFVTPPRLSSQEGRLSLNKKNGVFHLTKRIPPHHDPGQVPQSDMQLDVFLGKTHYRGLGKISREIGKTVPEVTSISQTMKTVLNVPVKIKARADFFGQLGGEIVWKVAKAPEGSFAKPTDSKIEYDLDKTYVTNFAPDKKGKYILTATAKVEGMISPPKEVQIETTSPPKLEKFKCRVLPQGNEYIPLAYVECKMEEASDPDGDPIEFYCDCIHERYDCGASLSPGRNLQAKTCSIPIANDYQDFAIEAWVESEGAKSELKFHEITSEEILKARKELSRLLQKKSH